MCDDEIVTITLIDFHLKINHQDDPMMNQQGINEQVLMTWLKSKFTMNCMKCFSLNNGLTKPIQSIEYKTWGVDDVDVSCDLKISYKLDCILACTERVIYVLDRKTKQLINRVELEFEYMNSVVNDKEDAFYLMALVDGNDDQGRLMKFRLHSLLLGKLSNSLWKTELDCATYGLVMGEFDGENFLLTTRNYDVETLRKVRCRDGQIVKEETPLRLRNSSALEVTSKNQFICCHASNKLEVFQQSEKQEWTSLHSMNFSDYVGSYTSYNMFSMFNEKNSGNIFATIPFGTNSTFLVLKPKCENDVSEGFHVIYKEKKIGKPSGLCIDGKSGQLLIAITTSIEIYE